MQPDVDIGYVFLFFYGLERRLIYDKPRGEVTAHEHVLIIEEIERLLKLYDTNSSFEYYAKQLLTFDWITSNTDAPLPPNLDLADPGYAPLFEVQVARFVAKGSPLPCRLMLQWYRHHPDYSLRTPARRCHEEFHLLFRQRYQEKFGQGIVIKPNKTRMIIEYQPASNGLSFSVFKPTPPLPDIRKLKAPLKKINPLVEACTAELDAYSRYIGRKNTQPDDIAALALLPSEILVHNQRFKQNAKDLRQWFENNSNAGLTSLADLYGILAEPLPEKNTKKAFEGLAAFLAQIGYGLAPDPRYHLIQIKPTDAVVLFADGHGQGFLPSYDFHMMVAILRLGAIISQIDKNVSPTEEALLAQTVTNHPSLTPLEKRSLNAFLLWCMRTPQKATGLKAGLANLSDTEKQAIGHILITVAHADGVIDPREVKQLEKLYTTLGLDKHQVTNDLHTMVTANKAIPSTPTATHHAKTSASIPTQTLVPKGFVLNNDLVQLHREETHQVKNVLQAIFDDSTEDEIQQSIDTLEGVTDEPLNDILPGGLDQPHQKLFHQVTIQEAWPSDAFDTHVKALGLMRNGAIEILNDWTFSISDAPLLEDEGDTVYVDLELAAEIREGHL